MKDQREQVREALLKAVKSELAACLKSGMTHQELAKKIGVQRTFITHVINDNEKGFKTVAIPKLILVANGLGLDVELIIKKKSSK